jgi:hypothetical protein
MERAEKRRLERERHKYEKQNIKEDIANKQWYSSLPMNRKIFIGKFVERRTIENDNLVAAIMDKCILGSLDDNTSIDIRLMKKVLDDCNGYILDYKEYLDKNGEGGFDMIENDKLRNEVIKRIDECIENGITKIKCMAALKKEFNLPGAELSEMWVECEKSMSKLIDEGLPSPEIITTGPNNSIRDSLKVIDHLKIIKGEFGYYHVSNDGVRFSNDIKLVNDDVAFKNKQRVIEEHYHAVNDINKDIMILEEKLVLLNKDKDLINAKFAEFEQSFDM